MLSKGETIMKKEEVEQYETLNKNFRSRGMELVCWYFVNYIKVTGENEGYWGMLFTEIQNHPEEVTVKIDEEKDEVVIEYLDADFELFSIEETATLYFVEQVCTSLVAFA